jgi:hypothetical protein
MKKKLFEPFKVFDFEITAHICEEISRYMGEGIFRKSSLMWALEYYNVPKINKNGKKVSEQAAIKILKHLKDKKLIIPTKFQCWKLKHEKAPVK